MKQLKINLVITIKNWSEMQEKIILMRQSFE